MSGEKKQGGAPDAADFDLQIELSALVADNIIPQSIAEKLEKKIVENRVDITKDQLYELAEKIHRLVQKYRENGSLPDLKTSSTVAVTAGSSSKRKTPDDDIELFLDKIKKLQQKIESLELENKKQEFSCDKKDVELKQNTTENILSTPLPYDEAISTEHNMSVDPLCHIPMDPERIIVLMNWIQYLVNRCGHDYLEDVLDYYVDVNWINDDVKISLLEYATGVTEESCVDKETTLKKKEKNANLLSKNHIQSYLYIQRLKGKKIEKHFVERINGELARVQKKIDACYSNS